MRALIAMTFFDSPENRRAPTTIYTVDSLWRQIDSRHIISVVDNGSTNTKAYDTLAGILSSGALKELYRLEEPRSIAGGVNYAWHLHEDELMSGELIAVKLDADMLVEPNDWLEQMLLTVERYPEIGILGPRMRGFEYDEFPNCGGWLETGFVHGGCAMRSPNAFRAIGYCRNPHGRWGWQDHWDVFRVKCAKLKLAILPTAETFGIVGRSALSKSYKKEIRPKGKEALLRFQAEVAAGERSIYEEYSEI